MDTLYALRVGFTQSNSLLYQYWIKTCRVHCSRHCTWVHFHVVLYRFKEMRFNPERAHQFKLENFLFFRQNNFIYACRNVPKSMKTSDTIFIRTPSPLNFHYTTNKFRYLLLASKNAIVIICIIQYLLHWLWIIKIYTKCTRNVNIVLIFSISHFTRIPVMVFRLIIWVILIKIE